MTLPIVKPLAVCLAPCLRALQHCGVGLIRPLTWGYWFAPGCRRSYQFSRYVFGLLYLYIAHQWLGYFGHVVNIDQHVDSMLTTLNPGMYRPLSVFYFLGNSPPPPIFFKICLYLLKFCPLALLLGFCSRLSLAGCTLGLFGLSLMEYSYALEWSHGFSPILVTSLALLLGPRHHDGFDGWLRRRTGRLWDSRDDGRARAAVLATQLLISLVFLNAAFYKWYAYGDGLNFFLAWVRSDTLRNVIIRQHIVFDTPLTGFFRFAVTHEFVYKGMALGNMLAQTLPFLGLFLMRRPYLRLLCGVALGSEVVGLGVVMGIWNWHWLLFIALFFDWDRLVFRTRAESAAVPPAVARPARVALAPLVQFVLSVVLLAFNGYVMFFYQDQQQWTFPFTSYPMFSQIIAEQPLRRHLPFYIPVSRFEFVADEPLSAYSLHGNWMVNWGMMWIGDTRAVNQQIRSVLESQNHCTIREMKAYRSILRVPPYPACEPEEVTKLMVYHYREGQVQAVLSQVCYDAVKKSYYIHFQVFGFHSPDVTVKYFKGNGDGPFVLPGTRSGDRFYYTRPDSRKVITGFVIEELGQPAIVFGGPLL